MFTGAILGLLLTVHVTNDGQTVFTNDTDPVPYKTMQECIDQAYEINRSETPYVLTCVPALKESDMKSSSSEPTT